MSADLSGKRFGRLTVVEEAEKRRMPCGSLKRMWKCVCECGIEVICQQQHLTGGRSNSCGCLHKEIARASATTHGGRDHPLYDVWTEMIQRCENPRHKRYADWGGRGIRVCDRWRHSFTSFLEDMGPRPVGYSIDRFPDNDGNYEPGNCRWATAKQQNENRRRRLNGSGDA
jgi:hypothetical protein